MRMRQRGWQSETRALTLGSILSTGQTRSQARSAGNCRTGPARFPQYNAEGRLSFFHGTLPFTLEPLNAKSKHGPSARAVIRITGPQKTSVALSGTVFLRASPVIPHIITSHGLSSASAPKTDKYWRSYQICRRDTGIRALPAGAGAHRLF
jgi:hypothetical protein